MCLPDKDKILINNKSDQEADTYFKLGSAFSYVVVAKLVRLWTANPRSRVRISSTTLAHDFIYVLVNMVAVAEMDRQQIVALWKQFQCGFESHRSPLQ